jgi:D-alanine-D-alanine ligase-like ATP-grasp enzyme
MSEISKIQERIDRDLYTVSVFGSSEALYEQMYDDIESLLILFRAKRETVLIQDIMRELAKRRVSTSMHYNVEKKQCYVDLETMAKSELHLYEDGMLHGRYQYEKIIDLSQNIEEIITELCHEFNNALHGRGYCQQEWADLCRERGIKLEMWM